MNLHPNSFHHIYNRGINHQKIFFESENYSFLQAKFKREVATFCSLLAYCLMPNHFHFLVLLPEDEKPFSKAFGHFLSSYTRAINRRYKRTGSLFQQNTKSKILEGEDAFVCFHYIHQNPVKAGLCDGFEDWKYSSFNEYYAGEQNICETKVTRGLLDLPKTKEAFMEMSKGVVINEKVLDAIK